MEFRYQEVLTWFMPGFYFLFYLVFESIFLFPSEGVSTDSVAVWNFIVGLKDGAITFIVFAIPFVSLIVGWIINGMGGFIFRKFFKGPIYATYSKLLEEGKVKVEMTGNFESRPGRNNLPNDGKDMEKFEKQAEWYFDDTREKINLGDVDRFYYRYVFSRNMLTAQIGIMVSSTILVLISPVLSCCSLMLNVGIALAVSEIFYLIECRDLSTHVKQVLIRRSSVGEMKNSNE